MHPDQFDDRPHGLAILAATASMAITMSLHPSGAQLLNDYAGTALKNVVAHGVALLGIPLALMGALAISGRLRRSGASGSADLAMVTYCVSNAAVLIAGTASGLIAPAVARRLTMPDPATEQIWRALFRYTGSINQAFATLYVIGLALSVLIWSLAIRRTGAFPRWTGNLGALLSVALLAVLIGSRAHLDVHTFGLVVLLQGAWMVAIAWPMVRRAPRAS